MKRSISVVLMVALLFALAATATAATATPIEDKTGILDKDKTWDAAIHELGGLQVERGNGFVNFVLSRSPDNTNGWGIHAFVTFVDATVAEVNEDDWFFNVLEVNGNDGTFGGGVPYNDEVDWLYDSARVSGGVVTADNELEMWLKTNSARDAFTANLTYGFCPRMKIELLDEEGNNYGGAEYGFEIGEAFYSYPSAVVPLAQCKFDIDIKPGSDPNCFNNDGNGVIPVAILGSEDFDVHEVSVETLSLDTMNIAARGKANKLLAAYEDVNGDGYVDLVIKIEDTDGVFEQGTATATLTGELLDGTPIEGVDEICITQ